MPSEPDPGRHGHGQSAAEPTPATAAIAAHVAEFLRGTDSVRRARAVIRDERRLRVALEHHRVRRFDEDAIAKLRDRTEDMLETMDALAADDSFWDAIATGSVLPSDRLARLERFDPGALPLLLEAFGYDSPPPPSAEDIVDDVTRSFADVLEGRERPLSKAGIDDARRSLRLGNMALRRKMPAPSITPTTTARLRVLARAAADNAGYVIPVAAALAGIAVDSHLPGAGVALGTIIAKKVAEDGVALGASNLLSRLTGRFDAADEPPRQWRTIDPIGQHAAAVRSTLEPIIAGLSGATALHGAYRHAERVVQLIEDHFPTADVALTESADRLLRVVRSADCLCTSGPLGDVDHDFALHAIAVADQLQELLRVSAPGLPFPPPL